MEWEAHLLGDGGQPHPARRGGRLLLRALAAEGSASTAGDPGPQGPSSPLSATLGPLQDLGVNAILTFTLDPNGTGTTVLVTYRIAGDATAGLGKLAPIVDQVIGDQVRRLAKLADTGKRE